MMSAGGVRRLVPTQTLMGPEDEGPLYERRMTCAFCHWLFAARRHIMKQPADASCRLSDKLSARSMWIQHTGSVIVRPAAAALPAPADMILWSFRICARPDTKPALPCCRRCRTCCLLRRLCPQPGYVPQLLRTVQSAVIRPFGVSDAKGDAAAGIYAQHFMLRAGPFLLCGILLRRSCLLHCGAPLYRGCPLCFSQTAQDS